jgi:hypothetical protein
VRKQKKFRTLKLVSHVAQGKPFVFWTMVFDAIRYIINNTCTIQNGCE